MENGHLKVEVTPEDKGKRLDKFLVEKFSAQFSRSSLQKLVSGGNVILNGERVKSHHKINSGDIIEVTVPERQETGLKPEDLPLDIVYEDDDVIVIDKPAGMVVHPAPGNYSGTLVNALLAHYGNLSKVGGDLKPGIVHRIDKGTSGLLIVAKTDMAHRNLAKQFKDKSIRRLYIALVEGVIELDNGIIDLPIGRSRRDRKKMAVDFVQSKNAVTRYHVIERFKDSTLVEASLGTGRTHQIRVHMEYLGHPLIGDDKYGRKNEFSRPALHAKVIGFVHPVTNKYMEFVSELPEDMKKLINRKRL